MKTRRTYCDNCKHSKSFSGVCSLAGHIWLKKDYLEDSEVYSCKTFNPDEENKRGNCRAYVRKWYKVFATR